ncbi:MAG: hypothetical protein ACKVXR_04940 [Planctomycetota bacterium]
MHRLFLSGSALALLAHWAAAQSINIDFQPADSPFGVPSPTYGGSAGSAGVWNAVSEASVSNLKAYDGSVTNVSLSTANTFPSCPGPGLFFAHDVLATSWNVEKLLDDRYAPDGFDGNWTFQGLAPGDYDVDTIILVHSGCTNQPNVVSVPGSPDPATSVAGAWPGGYVQGVPGTLVFGSNFARHHKTVTDGTLEVHVRVPHPVYQVSICGIQLNMHEQDYVGTSVCFGDGSVAPCPCGNDGQTRIGCENSQGTGGSWLFASGMANPDTIVLHAAGELPNALSIFWQGNIVIPHVVYGDGLRCFGGTLKRLYTKNASGGIVFAPAMGEPSITDRSAAMGVPISPGGRRYYQVAYRDGAPSFCPSPTGNTYNISNGVKIDW